MLNIDPRVFFFIDLFSSFFFASINPGKDAEVTRRVVVRFYVLAKLINLRAKDKS